jgi:hypothetical protein
MVIVQLRPGLRLNCFGVFGVNSTAPKSVTFGGAMAGGFEHPVISMIEKIAAFKLMHCCGFMDV